MVVPSDCNPYASPTASVDVPTDANADGPEAVRLAHLRHEGEIRTVGWLYYFAAFLTAIAWLLVAFRVGSQGGDATSRMLTGFHCFLVFAAFVGIGSGLRRLARWVRIPVGLFSCLGLLLFPAGTLLGSYILYLLFSKRGRTVFSAPYQQVIAETPHLKPAVSWVFWTLFVLFFLLPLLAFLLLPLFLDPISGRT